MRNTELFFYLTAMALLVVCCAFFSVRLDSVNEEIRSLKQENVQMQKLVAESCQETEARCERMTDTCLDIISNQRWE